MHQIEENENGELIFNCPKCGSTIFHPEEPIEPCKHCVMVYSDICGEFTHTDTKPIEKLEKKINKELKDGDKNASEMMEEFTDASKGKYELYSVTQSGIACGPVSFTDYFIIKMK